MDRLDEGDVHGSSADEDSDGSATKAGEKGEESDHPSRDDSEKGDKGEESDRPSQKEPEEKAPPPPEETGDVEPMEIEEGAGIKPAPPDLSGFDEEEDALEESKAEKEEYKDLGGYSDRRSVRLRLPGVLRDIGGIAHAPDVLPDLWRACSRSGVRLWVRPH